MLPLLPRFSQFSTYDFASQLLYKLKAIDSYFDLISMCNKHVLDQLTIPHKYVQLCVK